MPADDLRFRKPLTSVEIVELVSPVRFIAKDDGTLSQIECVRRELSPSTGGGATNSVSTGNKLHAKADRSS